MIHRLSIAVTGRAILVGVGLLAGTSSSLGQAKAPVPGDAARQTAVTLIEEVFGEKIADARTSAEKSALAGQLLQEAGKATDSTNRYALLRYACDKATEAGDADTALQAVDRMTRDYDVDAYKLQGRTLFQAAQSARLPAHWRAITLRGVTLIDQAVERNDFAAAEYLANLCRDAARKARDGELVKQAASRGEEVAEIATAYAAIADALAALRQAPTDPEANLAVGRYQACFKGEWQEGLPMLAWGTDGPLKRAAANELRGVTNSAGQVALGDGWWDLAETADGVTKRHLHGRAAYWYCLAMPGLTGLVEGKVKKRLSAVGDTAATISPPVAPPPVVQPSNPEPKTIELFDGTDLAAWMLRDGKGLKQNKDDWIVDRQNKILRCTGQEHSWLETRQAFGSFVLTVQWRFPPLGHVGPRGANGSGIVVCATGVDSEGRNPRGIEIDIRPKVDTPQVHTGAFITMDTPLRTKQGQSPARGFFHSGASEMAERPHGQWNEFRITRSADRLTVELNGKRVNEGWAISRQPGKICLRNQKCVVEFGQIVLQVIE
ncbi:MAG: DUF1080 domain-containing protein [Planctomycetes bacterium]|nr:DUF1080 domain-containing protein [Planctomycetota bacterium]